MAVRGSLPFRNHILNGHLVSRESAKLGFSSRISYIAEQSASVPGIDYIDVQTGEIPDVAGRDRQLVAPGRACDQRIAQVQCSPKAACLCPKAGRPYGRPGVEVQNAVAVVGQHVAQGVSQGEASLARQWLSLSRFVTSLDPCSMAMCGSLPFQNHILTGHLVSTESAKSCYFAQIL